ncbi:hypothetical protein BN946_scf184713.g2 [Trametes cinnabarina]|uniref:Uncharacterized protein n=1 Tax=Pycnoporus cinnabarinus TaxID=5643 RepID=A0A060SZZ3_PYCCI|nr:hypothetical protein BN946_scf184713.g2 [Trametes cinnabarina]
MEAEARGELSRSAAAATSKGKEKEKERPCKKWLPEGMKLVLEELPRWSLLAAILHEIEGEMMRLEPLLTSYSPGSNTVLIMASSLHTCTIIKNFLSTMDANVSRGSERRRMIEDKLRLSLWCKGKLSERRAEGKWRIALPKGKDGSNSASASKPADGVSEALKRGAPAPAAPLRDRTVIGAFFEGAIKQEADQIADFPSSQGIDLKTQALMSDTQLFCMDDDFDTHNGLLRPAQTVVVRPYSDDTDDRMLQEVKPRFIVMHEPNLEYIRCIELVIPRVPWARDGPRSGLIQGAKGGPSRAPKARCWSARGT